MPGQRFFDQNKDFPIPKQHHFVSLILDCMESTWVSVVSYDLFPSVGHPAFELFVLKYDKSGSSKGLTGTNKSGCQKV